MKTSRSALSRRSVVAGAVPLTVAGLAGGMARPIAAQAAAAQAAALPGSGATYQLLAAPDMNFEVLFALGESAYGAGEAGEVLATVNAINAAGASYQTFFDNFMSLAARLDKLASEAARKGDKVTTRSASLRAAQYYNQALFFVLGTAKPDREPAIYAAMQRNWARAASLFTPVFEPVSIPYEETTIPGYFMAGRGSGSARRPTVIIMNGSDAQNIDVYAFGGSAAIERGWNALIFEGPGQGSMLFERKIPFRPDWEKVITPIVDFLVKRTDVDSSRIGLTGWSFGGALVTRAAAFEHRLAAVVADPGYLSDWAAYPPSLRGLFDHGMTKAQIDSIWQKDIIPKLTPQERFTLSKRSEIFGVTYLEDARAGRMFPSLWDYAHTLMSYDIASVAAKVETPMLVLQYEHDQFFPGGGKALYDLLTCSKTLVTFTEAEGAALHDCPLAPQRRNEVVFDWLEKTCRITG